jgi:putative ABC transport system substrate-binding protein
VEGDEGKNMTRKIISPALGALRFASCVLRCLLGELMRKQFAFGAWLLAPRICPAVFLGLSSMLLAPCFRAEAQQSKKVTRIGYLAAADPATDSARSEAIRRALRELGYVEGQNIAIEYRYAAGKRDRYPELVNELLRLKVDIILIAGADYALQAAKNATKTVPIIMLGAGLDPVHAGLVESLAHPGGNITGVTSLAGELVGKRLEVLTEAAPKIARVAVLYDGTVPDSVFDVKEVLPGAVRTLRLTSQQWQMRSADDFDKAFPAIAKWPADGIYVPRRSPLMRTHEKRIVAFALKNRLPSMYANRQSVDAGGLMSYAADLAESYRRVAYYVDKIIKGAKPADLPVEQPTKFELVINLKTAQQIGLTIPPNVLARADRVIR